MSFNNQEAKNILLQMLDDMANQPQIYQPTAFWKIAAKEITKELMQNSFDDFRTLPSILSFFVPTYGVPGNALTMTDITQIESLLIKKKNSDKKHAMMMHMLTGESFALADYRVYLAADQTEKLPKIDNVSESKVGNPSEHFYFHNSWFSRSFLNYLLGVCFLKQHVTLKSSMTILEVGGGYGTLGEILHKSNGNYAYINIDIPPTAAVSTYYLGNIQDLHLVSYADSRKMEAISIPAPGTQMVLCPWQLPKLWGDIDLFVNFISFQEMEPPVVEFYTQQAERLKAKFILLRNLREGKQKKTHENSVGVETPIVSQDYDQFLKNYRLISSNVMPFGYRTVDGYHSELRLYERVNTK